MEELENRLLEIFNDNWNNSVKVVQKDMNFMFYKNNTRIVTRKYNKSYLVINCSDWIKVSDYEIFFQAVKNNIEFWNEFDILCKDVIGREFKLFHDYSYNKDYSYLKRFIEEQHGSGVNSLFWFFFFLKNASNKTVVIDNIDGFLHPISMRQFCIVLKENFKDYKFIFLMNNDELMTTSIMNIDDLYSMDGTKIKKIQDCTDRELKIAHNLQNLYRAGEFTI